MDSSELTKNKRNRVTANSLSGGGIARPHSNITMNSQVLTSFRLGGKYIDFNKRTILPACQPPLCDTDADEHIDPVPEPPFYKLDTINIFDAVIIGDSVYIVGSVYDVFTNLFVSNGTNSYSTPAVNIPANSGIIAKYNFNAELQWITTVETGSARSITTDGINIYVGGSISDGGVLKSASPYTFQQSFTYSVDTLSMSFISKYDLNGQLMWGTVIRSTRDIYIGKIHYLNNDLYIGGSFGDTIQLYNADGTTTLPTITSTFDSGINAYNINILLCKYSSDGFSIWQTKIGRNKGFDDLTVDSSGIYVVGIPYKDEFLSSSDNNTELYDVNDNSIMNFFQVNVLAKYNFDGTLIWATSVNTNPDRLNQGFRIQVKNNYIYIAIVEEDDVNIYNASASYGDPTFVMNFNTGGPSLVKYDTEGQYVYHTNSTGAYINGTTSIQAMCVDDDSNIYLTGFAETDRTFYDSDLITSSVLQVNPPNITIFIIKYNSEGVLQWKTKIEGPGFNISTLIKNINTSEFLLFGRLPESNPKTIYQPDGLNTPVFSSTFDVPIACNCMIKYTV